MMLISISRRIWETGRLFILTGATQTIVQIFGLFTGFMVVRMLPTNEYAYYTLVNTMLGSMVMLADSGISNGVLSEGGKVWKDKKRLGVVVATGLKLRRRMGKIVLAIMLPILCFLLIKNGASPIAVILGSLMLSWGFWATLSDSLYEIAPKLNQEIVPLQRNQLEVGFGRMLLSITFLSLFPMFFMAIAAFAIPRVYGNIRIAKISSNFAVAGMTPSTVNEISIKRSVNRTLPIVIYHCVSGQVAIWLLSIWGTTNSVAQIGAIGRFVVIFPIITSVFSSIIIPRFARQEENKSRLFKLFLGIQLAVLAMIACIWLFVRIFSEEMLWLLGKEYLGLSNELFLLMLGSGVALLQGICSELVVCRGWYLQPHFLIILNTTLTLLLFLFFDPSSLVILLWYNLFSAVMAYLLVMVYGLYKISSLNKQKPFRI